MNIQRVNTTQMVKQSKVIIKFIVDFKYNNLMWRTLKCDRYKYRDYIWKTWLACNEHESQRRLTPAFAKWRPESPFTDID